MNLSKTEQIAFAYREEIRTGVIHPGEALPSTKDIAARFGVSLGTVTAAMKTLTDEGLLTSKPRGPRIVRHQPSTTTPKQPTTRKEPQADKDEPVHHFPLTTTQPDAPTATELPTQPAGCCRDDPTTENARAQTIDAATTGGELTRRQFAILEAVTNLALSSGAPAAQHAGEQLVALLAHEFGFSPAPPVRRRGGLIDAFLGPVSVDVPEVSPELRNVILGNGFTEFTYTPEPEPEPGPSEGPGDDIPDPDKGDPIATSDEPAPVTTPDELGPDNDAPEPGPASEPEDPGDTTP